MDFQTALDGHRAAIDTLTGLEDEVHSAVRHLQATFRAGGRVFVCGNGGSAADAQHFAAELTGRYRSDRPGFPAIALTTDTSALTSIGNDYGFERVYARQLESLARTGDCLVAISTSGNSPNILAAVNAASQLGVTTLGLLGRDGGAMGRVVDHALTVPVDETARIQEAHILLLHILCDAFEDGPCS